MPVEEFNVYLASVMKILLVLGSQHKESLASCLGYYVKMIVKNNENFLEEKSQNSWPVKPTKGLRMCLGCFCSELGFPGAPWPSAHCPTSLNSSTGNAAGEGAWRGRECITTKLHNRLIYIIHSLLSR